MSENTTDTRALQERVRQLQQRIDEVVGAARRRKNFTLILMLFVIVAMAFYLTFAYNQIASVNGQMVAELADARIRLELDNLQREGTLVKALEDQAPKVIGDAEKHLLALPGEIERQLERRVRDTVVKFAPGIEEELVKAMVSHLERIRTSVKGEGASGQVSEGEFQKMLEELARSLVNEMDKRLVMRVHAMYGENSMELLAYLERLADGKDLTPREQVHRNLVVQVLTLLARYQQMAERGEDVSGLSNRFKQVVEDAAKALPGVTRE